jgi:2-oxoisovalerate dehydrogenase E1 component
MVSTADADHRTEPPGQLPEPLEVRYEPIIRTALLIRRAEERLLSLFAEGELAGTVHTCVGQELIGATFGEVITDGDTVFSGHRGHGHFLAVTGDLVGLLAEVMGREAGVNGGRGGSQHLHRDGFYSGGILGGLLPVAAGTALAHQRAGTDRIAVAFIGDGGLGEGVVYETLNLAALWRLPLLVVVENNRVAQSTDTRDTVAGQIEWRAEAFGIPVHTADTWDLPRLVDAAGHAVGRVRAGDGPHMLVVDTYRLAPHSKGDDHRDPGEIAAYWARDELARLLDTGTAPVLDMDLRARRLVDDALATAKSTPVAEPSDAAPVVPGPVAGWKPGAVDGRRFVTALQEALRRLMSDHPTMLVAGEDVRDPYGGAFKATAGLSTRFPDRVRNTPISEAAIVGLGSGLALRGQPALVEIMFGDFVLLTMDQLVNQAAKLLPGLVGGRLVVRTPMGGHRGYGPTHSQTLDRHLVGVPGLRVVAVNSLVDPYVVYSALLSGDGDPTVVLENKLLYGRRLGAGVPEGFEVLMTPDPLPVVRVDPGVTPDVSLVGYGGMVDDLLAAADELFAAHDIVAQVVCPTQIYPFDVRPLLPVLDSAPAVVVAEEGQGFAGFGAEVLAQLAEHAPHLVARARRVSAAAVPIPASRPLEKAALPGTDTVVRAVLEATGGR